MNQSDLEQAADAMWEETLRSEEFAHDGDRLPKEFRAQVYRILSDKAKAFADYLERTK